MRVGADGKMEVEETVYDEKGNAKVTKKNIRMEKDADGNDV